MVYDVIVRRPCGSFRTRVFDEFDSILTGTVCSLPEASLPTTITSMPAYRFFFQSWLRSVIVLLVKVGLAPEATSPRSAHSYRAGGRARPFGPRARSTAPWSCLR